MIAAEVELARPMSQDLYAVFKWCNRYIGNEAIWKDVVGKDNPWCHNRNFGSYTFYFYDEKDATMFRLKWG